MLFTLTASAFDVSWPLAFVHPIGSASTNYPPTNRRTIGGENCGAGFGVSIFCPTNTQTFSSSLFPSSFSLIRPAPPRGGVLQVPRIIAKCSALSTQQKSTPLSPLEPSGLPLNSTSPLKPSTLPLTNWFTLRLTENTPYATKPRWILNAGVPYDFRTTRWNPWGFPPPLTQAFQLSKMKSETIPQLNARTPKKKSLLSYFSSPDGKKYLDKLEQELKQKKNANRRPENENNHASLALEEKPVTVTRGAIDNSEVGFGGDKAVHRKSLDNGTVQFGVGNNGCAIFFESMDTEVVSGKKTLIPTFEKEHVVNDFWSNSTCSQSLRSHHIRRAAAATTASRVYRADVFEGSQGEQHLPAII
jgi:hypothetical protein